MNEKHDKIAPVLARLCDQDEPPLLMFDYDGTLAPFVVNRDLAYPYPESKTLLKELCRTTRARVVVVSGRPVADIARLLDLSPQPETWGCHGWERCTASGELVTGALPEEARDLLAHINSWFAEAGWDGQVEHKPASLALHWRGLGKAEQRRLENYARNKWADLADQQILQLHAFDGGLEWRLTNWSKADAVTTLMRESPSGTPVAYFGDDLTDEDAFRALPQGGVAVLVRDQYRKTEAELWLQPPGEMNAFLVRLLQRLQGRHGKTLTGESS